MLIENVKVFGWEHAISGMRKSWNSEHKSDSTFGVGNNILFGADDIKLMLKLIKAGDSHRKFLRCVHIQARVVAPFYWWTEMDTYKIGVTRLSSSTMHTIAKRELNSNDFAFDCNTEVENNIINLVNVRIDEYKKRKSVENLRKIKQTLPSSFLYDCILDFNYENVLNVYKFRHDHRLKEWQQFLTAIENTTPLMKEILDARFQRER